MTELRRTVLALYIARGWPKPEDMELVLMPFPIPYYLQDRFHPIEGNHPALVQIINVDSSKWKRVTYSKVF